jgi:hypothetical protein
MEDAYSSYKLATTYEIIFCFKSETAIRLLPSDLKKSDVIYIFP